MRFDTISVEGFYPALRGMRNPMNSWEKSDSYSTWDEDANEYVYVIGEKDMTLARNLIKAGSEHSKFMRQIQVWVDVTAPRYWWQEADTYKFGTKNSCSTMHKIMSRPIDVKDFFLGETPSALLVNRIETVCGTINVLISKYHETKHHDYLLDVKRLLPESYMQMRTWNTNYAELMNAYRQRKNHRLKEEWGAFCQWCDELPYFNELTEGII